MAHGLLTHTAQSLQEHLNRMIPHLQSRQHQIVSEFSFWPSSPPRDSGYEDGGVYEMRTYQLQPGKLIEWEHAWRRGLEARKRFVVSPVRAARGFILVTDSAATRRCILQPDWAAARG